MACYNPEKKRIEQNIKEEIKKLLVGSRLLVVNTMAVLYFIFSESQAFKIILFEK